MHGAFPVIGIAADANQSDMRSCVCDADCTYGEATELCIVCDAICGDAGYGDAIYDDAGYGEVSNGFDSNLDIGNTNACDLQGEGIDVQQPDMEPAAGLALYNEIAPMAANDVNLSDYSDVITIQSALDSALGGAVSGESVNVTGSFSGAAERLTLNIPAGVTLIWGAAYSGSLADNLIVIYGDGIFSVTGSIVNDAGGVLIASTNADVSIIIDGGTVQTTASSGIAISPNGNMQVNAGTVSAVNGAAIFTFSGVTISGGVVEATDYNGYAIMGGGDVIVSGGVVRSNQDGGRAIGIDGDVAVSGTGLVQADGEGGYAVLAFGNVTVSETGKVQAGGEEGTAILFGGSVTIDGAGMVQANGDGGTAIIIPEDAENSGVTINSGTVQAGGDSGAAISVNSADSSVKVNGGVIQAGGIGGAAIAIGADGESATIEINGGAVLANGDSGRAIACVAENSAITVNDGMVQAIGDLGIAIGIRAQDSAVTVNGGAVSATSGQAIFAFIGDVTVSGGVVSAADGAAIAVMDGGINVSGGVVSATDGIAIGSYYDNVEVSGGFVFAYGTAMSDVVYVDSGIFSGPTSNGIIVAWDNTIQSPYEKGSAAALTVIPAGSAVWDIVSSQNGISYARDTNTGFFQIDGVTVRDSYIQYEVVSGSPVTWTGSGDAAWTINAPFNTFLRLTKNGAVISPEHYSVAEGSTIITVKQSYLMTLSNGEYLFRADFPGGYADLRLIVNVSATDPGGGQPGNGQPGDGQPGDGQPGNGQASQNVPQTGDNNSMLLWWVMLAASVLMISGALIYRKGFLTISTATTSSSVSK